MDVPAESYNFSQDPKVLADFEASGLRNWLTYWSTWRVRLTRVATDPYMTEPTLRAGILKGAYLTMYQVQGTNDYFGNWTQVRNIGSPMPSGLNRSASMHYSTTDMYVDHPEGWWECSGSNHGVCYAPRDSDRRHSFWGSRTVFHGKARTRVTHLAWVCVTLMWCPNRERRSAGSTCHGGPSWRLGICFTRLSWPLDGQGTRRTMYGRHSG